MQSLLVFLSTLLIAVFAAGHAEAIVQPAIGAIPNAVSLDASCDTLFGLQPGTVATPNLSWLNEDKCKIFEYLRARVNAAAMQSCTTAGQNGITINKAITGLNSVFATNLYDMLLRMPGLQITSAYRKNACQNSAHVIAASSLQGNDPHQKGCAADLGYDTNSCGTLCQSVKQYTLQPNSGLSLPFVNTAFTVTLQGEANHMQAADLTSCEANSGVAQPPASVQIVQAPGVTSGTVCVITTLGQQVCGQQNNPYSPFGQNGLLGGNNLMTSYSPFGQNGLLGGNNSMTSMMTMMMGMQLLQGLNSSLTNASTQNTAIQTPVPTPLPPIPVTPISTTPTTVGGSSTIDDLLAALNTPTTTVCASDAHVCPDGTTVGRTGPNCSFAACPSRTSTLGQIVSTSTPSIRSGNISVSSSSLNDLQSAFGSLEVASATLASDGAQSTSTLQTVLNNLYGVISSIASFIANVFGIGTGSLSAPKIISLIDIRSRWNADHDQRRGLLREQHGRLQRIRFV